MNTKCEGKRENNYINCALHSVSAKINYQQVVSKLPKIPLDTHQYRKEILAGSQSRCYE